MSTILFCNGNILKVGKVNYGEKKVTSSEFTRDMNEVFTMSCTVDTINSNLKELFVDRDSVDCYIVKGTTVPSPRYRRCPRKLKKAVKIIHNGVARRRTKWMNLAVIKKKLDYTKL